MRKYLSNRGSALFMVISTMTALMITCLAMYFSVVSMRSAGFAVFNQQQSYQSAISVADMVREEISAVFNNAGVSLATFETDYAVCDTIITTDGNGFKSLNPNAANIDDQYLGAYDVTMSRLENEVYDGDVYYTVDVAVTVSVSGVKEVYHQIINIPKKPENDGTSPNKGDIFASTGYIPNDSFISKGRFFSDVYISNEDAVMGAFDGNELHFFQSIFCENSLTLLDYTTPQNYSSDPIIHAVRCDYNIGKGNPLGFAGGSYILVGNDMHVSRGMNISSGSGDLEVYVAGDLYIESSASNLSGSKVKFYVAGDVYVNSVEGTCIPGVLYCKKIHGLNPGTSYGSYYEEGLNWELDKENKHGDGSRQMSLTFKEAMQLLEDKTPESKYKLWKLNEDTLSDDIGKTNADGTISGGRRINLNFKSINNQNAYKPIEIKYDSDKYGKGCVLQEITVDRGGLMWGTWVSGTEDGKMPTLIIDTGDDPTNTYAIRLQANNQYTTSYTDPDTKEKKVINYFSWRPKHPDGTLATYPIQVLVKGNGSVVIDVPDGVVYQDSSFCHIMHYNWYMLGDNSSGLGYENGVAYYKNTQGIQGSISDYVHSNCGDSCYCNYTVTKVDEACAYCGNEVTYDVKCNLHEEYNICPKCDDEYFSGDEDHPTIDPHGICKDRVEKKKCIDSLKLIDSASRPVNRDSKGNIVVPNSNIFLISCSESAEFRFGRTIDDASAIDKNCFIGFIYAPYMSYKANGKDAGEYYMHVGGMVVADYKFLSLNRFLACWPTVYPPENVLDESSLSTNLNPVTEKRYRVRLKAIY